MPSSCAAVSVLPACSACMAAASSCASSGASAAAAPRPCAINAACCGQGCGWGWCCWSAASSTAALRP